MGALFNSWSQLIAAGGGENINVIAICKNMVQQSGQGMFLSTACGRRRLLSQGPAL